MTPDRSRTVIGPLTASILYGLLMLFAIFTLKGKPLMLALVVVLGLAAKSYLHYWKEKSR